MRVFAFLDVDHVPTAWAVMRGMLISARCNPGYIPGCLSFMLAGIIFHGNNARLHNELIIEDYRLKHFPSKTSRLEGLYFFESRAEALRIANSWGGHFVEKNLYELEFRPSVAPNRLDSDWITYENDLTNSKWIDDYWRGTPRSPAPAWEIIGHGVAVVLDMQARARAYDLVNAEFPDCWIAIEMARIACEMDASPAGTITPWLLKEDQTSAMLAYLLRNAEYNDKQTIDAMVRHQDFGRLATRWRAADSIKMPAFQPWMRKLRTEWTAVSAVAARLPSVHSVQMMELTNTAVPSAGPGSKY